MTKAMSLRFICCIFINCAPQIQEQKISENSNLSSESQDSTNNEFNRRQNDDKVRPEIFGWVNRDVINARMAPTIKSDIVSKLAFGSRIKLIEQVDEVVISQTTRSRWWETRIANFPGLVYIDSSLISLEKVESDYILDKINFDSTTIGTLESFFNADFEIDVFLTFAGGNWVYEGKLDNIIYEAPHPKAVINGLTISQVDIFAEPDTTPLRIEMLYIETYSPYEKLKNIFMMKNFKLLKVSIDGSGHEYGSYFFDDINTLYISLGEIGIHNTGAAFTCKKTPFNATE